MGNHSSRRQPGESPAPAQPTRMKRPYLSPSLIEYGTVAKLTQSGFGSGDDGGIFDDMMMKCL